MSVNKLIISKNVTGERKNLQWTIFECIRNVDNATSCVIFVSRFTYADNTILYIFTSSNCAKKKKYSKTDYLSLAGNRRTFYEEMTSENMFCRSL